MTPLTFPIMLDQELKCVPWAFMAPHEEQAKINHSGQDLARLAARGGVSPCEAIAIVEGRPWERMPLTAATLQLKQMVEQWKGRNTPALQAPPAPDITTRLEHALGLVQRLRDGKAIPHRAHWNELEAILQAAIGERGK